MIMPFFLILELCCSVCYASFSFATEEEQEQQELHVVLEPRQHTQLAVSVLSKVNIIYKKMGDSFEKGDLLIHFEDEVPRQLVEKAKAVLEKAEIAYVAKQELFEEQIASLAEVKEAMANVATARADLAYANYQLKECTVRAPYRGKVASLSIEQYELPKQVAEPLMEIIDDEILIAKILVPASEFDRIVLKRPLYLAIRGKEALIETTITRLAPLIDPSSDTLQIEAEINNGEGKLLAGMTGIALFDKNSFEKSPASQEQRIDETREWQLYMLVFHATVSK